jgi:N-acylneuraminate cytidylyltransferase
MAVESNAVAIIPARGGSKRIPRKNVRPFLGEPLIARTIGRIAAAGVFEQVVVSTDDEEIAEVAQSAGAQVPFLRPAELADDFAGSRPVVQHAIRALEETSPTPLQAVCVVYATAVFLEPEDLIAGRHLLDDGPVDFVAAVTTYDAPVQRALRIRADGCGEMVDPQYLETRSQDLEARYHDVGQFYWGRRDAWLSGHDMFSRQVATRLFELPRWRALDLDTPEDWEFAERMAAAASPR